MSGGRRRPPAQDGPRSARAALPPRTPPTPSPSQTVACTHSVASRMGQVQPHRNPPGPRLSHPEPEEGERRSTPPPRGEQAHPPPPPPVPRLPHREPEEDERRPPPPPGAVPASRPPCPLFAEPARHRNGHRILDGLEAVRRARGRYPDARARRED